MLICNFTERGYGCAILFALDEMCAEGSAPGQNVIFGAWAPRSATSSARLRRPGVDLVGHEVPSPWPCGPEGCEKQRRPANRGETSTF